MENKHIIAAGIIGLMILLMVLFIFQSGGSQNPNPSDLLNLNLNNKESSIPEIKELAAKDLKIGTGSAEVKPDDIVTVHYVGFLPDGIKFESSYEANKPLIIGIGEGKVIKGLEQGIMGMKLGGKRRIFIPAEFAYGAEGKGSVPPNSSVIFDVEVIDIKKPTEPTPPHANPSTSPEVSPTGLPTSNPMPSVAPAGPTEMPSSTPTVSPTPSPNP